MKRIDWNGFWLTIGLVTGMVIGVLLAPKERVVEPAPYTVILAEGVAVTLEWVNGQYELSVESE